MQLIFLIETQLILSLFGSPTSVTRSRINPWKSPHVNLLHCCISLPLKAAKEVSPWIEECWFSLGVGALWTDLQLSHVVSVKLGKRGSQILSDFQSDCLSVCLSECLSASGPGVEEFVAVTGRS